MKKTPLLLLFFLFAFSGCNLQMESLSASMFRDTQDQNFEITTEEETAKEHPPSLDSEPQKNLSEILAEMEEFTALKIEIPADSKKIFLENAIDVLAQSMLISQNLNNPPEEIYQILSILGQMKKEYYVGPIFMIPKNPMDFEKKKEPERKLCLGLFRVEDEKPVEILLTAGNACHPGFITKNAISKKKTDAKKKINVISIFNASEYFFTKEKRYPLTIEELVTKKYLPQAPENISEYTYFSDGKNKFCISASLSHASFEKEMQKDDGKNPYLLEKGSECYQEAEEEISDQKILSFSLPESSLSDEEKQKIWKDYIRYAVNVYMDEVIKISSLKTIPQEIRQIHLVLEQFGKKKNAIDSIFLEPKAEEDFVNTPIDQRKICVAYTPNTKNEKKIQAGNGCEQNY